MTSIKNALFGLLESLEAIDEEFEYGLHDTVVREELVFTIIDGFVKDSDHHYDIDDRLAYSQDWEGGKYCYSTLDDDCDLEVHKALKVFLRHPEVIAVDKKMTTQQMRLDMFQDYSVVSSKGNTIDYWFGGFGFLE